MKFVLDAEQRLFGSTVDKLLAGSDVPAAIRSGDPAARRELWTAVAGTGVFALAVPEAHGGAGTHPVELVTAMHELGRHAVPGPIVETLAAAELLARLGDTDWLPRIADGAAVVSLALPPAVPYALDADLADLTLLADGDRVRAGGAPGPALASLDPGRRLFRVEPGEVLATGAGEHLAAARDLGALACAAQQLGVGRRLLETSVAYAKTRRQFDRPIGEFQAVKHQLAEVLVGLEFARPLVHGAALAYGTADFPRDVSAAKVAAAEAGYAAARTALQVHGAIGYTDEYDPSLWIRKARVLRTAWGSPADHRARVAASL